MATVAGLLTLAQFHEQYDSERGYEFWFGKVVRKPMPTWLHGALQIFLGELFFRLGYFTSSEVSLRIDPNWEPRPDIAASLSPPEGLYPTRPVDIAIEIPSKNQTPTVTEKCQHYARIGIPQILVFDLDSRIVSQWSRPTDRLEPIEEIKFSNGDSIAISDIWAEFETRHRKQPATTSPLA
jgi:Uma2 family endonuclease